MTQLFSLTDTAVSKIKDMLSEHKDKMGLRIGLNTRGCAGLSYTMDYATSENIDQLYISQVKCWNAGQGRGHKGKYTASVF